MEHIDFLEMISRTTGAFLALLIMTRLMGKKQMSQLTFFNYVTGITIGSIAALIAGDSETPFWNGFVSLIWWSLLTLAVGWISMRFANLRVAIDGQPTIIVKKGTILERAMKRTRLNLDDFSMMLREEGVFSIQEVEYAILEPNGKISVLKKQEQRTPTRRDLRLPISSETYLPSEIICDGRIVEKNLKELGLNAEWLANQLSGTKPEQVFYAELQADGTLYYQKKKAD